MVSKPRLTVVVGLLLLALPAAPAAEAQDGTETVRVALEVSERTGGVLEERLRETLTALDDVEVVGRSDPAHYVLNFTALCVPDSEVCETAESYSVSVVLSEPLTGAELRSGLSRTGTDVLADWEPFPEADAYLRRYRRMHATWAASWDRDAVGSSMERLLRGIDARCFEKRRIVEARRAAAERRGERAEAEAAGTLEPEGDWLC